MKRLTPACNSFRYYLKHQYGYFRNKGVLAEDGSFYKTDNEAAKVLGVSSRTIKRCRDYLEATGAIRTIEGKYRGNATRYWILEKDDKLPKKDDKLPKKGCQNVTPSKENKEINKKRISDKEVEGINYIVQDVMKVFENKKYKEQS